MSKTSHLFRRRLRPLLKFPRPPEDVAQFPPHSQTGTGTLPSLMKPWLKGVRAFWLPEDRVFQLESGQYITVTGIEPQTPYNEPLEGVFYEKGKNQAHILESILHDDVSTKMGFNIVDLAMQDNASSRAQLCQQIVSQQNQHVYVVQMIEVHTPDAFNQWLAQWQASLFAGALVVGYMEPWGATEYEVNQPWPREGLRPTA